MERFFFFCAERTFASSISSTPSYLALSKLAHHHRVHTSTSCDKHHTPIHASTVLVLSGWVANYFSKAASPKNMVLCPRLTLFCCCCAKHVTAHKPISAFLCKAPFSCFGNSFISHTQMTGQLGLGAFTPPNDRGGVYCVVGTFLTFFALTGGAILPFFAKNRGVYSHYSVGIRNSGKGYTALSGNARNVWVYMPGI